MAGSLGILKLSVFLIIGSNLLTFLVAFDEETYRKLDFEDYTVLMLEPNKPFSGIGEKFEIYCYDSLPKSLTYVWKSVYLEFERVPLNYKLYGGDNATDVYEKYNSDTIWHPISWISWRDRAMDFPAFSPYCIGVKTRETYVLQLIVRNVNYWKVLQTVIGITLFLSAASLSRNSFFHYASGISVGVFASLLILLFVAARFIPKKGASYAILLFGYSFIFYFIQQFYSNLQDIVSKYSDIMLGYVFLTSFVSFVVCYRIGPVKNVRTINLIQWSMQVIALLLIFFSTEYREISTALILVLLGIYCMPARWLSKPKFLWYRFFPPRVKLLTETEYIEQGNKETKRALEELRTFCRSPECKVWETVASLKDAKRFANFMKGDSHITDEEILSYDSDCSQRIDFTDDEDDDRTFQNTRHRANINHVTPPNSHYRHD